MAEPLTGDSCKNVPCEDGLICCDVIWVTAVVSASINVLRNKTPPPSCSTPKGGINNDLDSKNNSGCPPLGLYTCNYTLPCKAGSYSDNSACDGKRSGGRCKFSVSATCHLTEGGSLTSYSGTCGSTGDPCSVRGKEIPGSCKPCSPTGDISVGGDTGADGNTGQQQNNCDCEYEPSSDRSCNATVTGTCGTPTGSCTAKGPGGGLLSQI